MYNLIALSLVLSYAMLSPLFVTICFVASKITYAQIPVLVRSLTEVNKAPHI